MGRRTSAVGMRGGTVTTAERWRQRLGVPDARGNGRLLWAVVTDTIGVGMFLPLSFLYFTISGGLSATTVGAAVTAASLGALVLGGPAGWLADRFDPRRLLAVNNVVVAIGYAMFPFVDSGWGVLVAVATVSAADRVYWAAWPSLVSRLADATDLDRWFAFTEMVKNACMGLGAVAGTLLLANGGTAAATWLLALNVVSSLSPRRSCSRCAPYRLVRTACRPRRTVRAGERSSGTGPWCRSSSRRV
jgi:MFS family permease